MEPKGFLVCSPPRLLIVLGKKRRMSGFCFKLPQFCSGPARGRVFFLWPSLQASGDFVFVFFAIGPTRTVHFVRYLPPGSSASLMMIFFFLHFFPSLLFSSLPQAGRGGRWGGCCAFTFRRDTATEYVCVRCHEYVPYFTQSPAWCDNTLMYATHADKIIPSAYSQPSFASS